jgi:ankyrin repeat protein
MDKTIALISIPTLLGNLIVTFGTNYPICDLFFGILSVINIYRFRSSNTENDYLFLFVTTIFSATLSVIFGWIFVEGKINIFTNQILILFSTIIFFILFKYAVSQENQTKSKMKEHTCETLIQENENIYAEKHTRKNSNLKNRIWNFLNPPETLLTNIEEKGHQVIIEYLVSLGVNDFNKIMCLAAEKGHRDFVEYLVSKGANDFGRGLYYAARGGHLEIVKYFISLGAYNFDDATCTAAEKGHQDIVKHLLIDTNRNLMNDAMIFAKRGGNQEMIKYLLIKKCGEKNVNSLMFGAAYEGQLELVKYFISKGAHGFEEAIVIASSSNHQEIVDYLRSLLPSYAYGNHQEN